MSERLPSGVEVSALIRRVQGEGGFASILHKGDTDRGTISLLIAERGEMRALLERRMAADFSYRWTEVPSSVVEEGSDWREWVKKASQIDPDCWILELDIADAQRFIAETTAAG
ncbi:DUF1491 family protein [Sphingomonas alba]|uniref:DUF1491 family protein n=1 Tax=Sphingomonas alba TaxID=2908208 RepID=A0ABT0RMN0_9SPHN|nr:DUF1491 family protein [Sphingomonas alba]MCL6683840.1 DUF1491 family protein [Sphingomonas alba]